MLTLIFIIVIITLLLFFICSLRLSSEADRNIEKYLCNKCDKKEINITKWIVIFFFFLYNSKEKEDDYGRN